MLSKARAEAIAALTACGWGTDSEIEAAILSHEDQVRDGGPGETDSTWRPAAVVTLGRMCSRRALLAMTRYRALLRATPATIEEV